MGILESPQMLCPDFRVLKDHQKPKSVFKSKELVFRLKLRQTLLMLQIHGENPNLDSAGLLSKFEQGMGCLLIWQGVS